MFNDADESIPYAILVKSVLRPKLSFSRYEREQRWPRELGL